MECLLDPRWYFPYSSESYQAPLYAKWFQTGGKSGEEPPPVIKGLMETFTKIAQTVSEEKRKELFKQIIAANEENLWVIGVVYPPPDYYVVSVNMHNVPTRDFEGWKYPNPGPIHPEQFFLTKK
jgi:peptide/nickel transport system substrate-binding protein